MDHRRLRRLFIFEKMDTVISNGRKSDQRRRSWTWQNLQSTCRRFVESRFRNGKLSKPKTEAFDESSPPTDVLSPSVDASGRATA
jgi:hypothetical protein